MTLQPTIKSGLIPDKIGWVAFSVSVGHCVGAVHVHNTVVPLEGAKVLHGRKPKLVCILRILTRFPGQNEADEHTRVALTVDLLL